MHWQPLILTSLQFVTGSVVSSLSSGKLRLEILYSAWRGHAIIES